MICRKGYSATALDVVCERAGPARRLALETLPQWYPILTLKWNLFLGYLIDNITS
jgi:hypothetical protein